MDYQITFALLDAYKLLIGLNYKYSKEENVYIFEFGFIFGYIQIALKKKEEE